MLPFAIFSYCTQPYWLRTYVIIPQNFIIASVFLKKLQLFYHLSEFILADDPYAEVIRLLKLASCLLARQNEIGLL